MSTSDIIKRLSKLQLEQNTLIAQLIKQNNKEVPSIKGGLKPPKHKSAEDSGSGSNDSIKVGDHITLLTNGVRSKKGDEATVFDIKGKTVKFVVNKNGHNTYRKIHNVHKAYRATQLHLHRHHHRPHHRHRRRQQQEGQTEQTVGDTTIRIIIIVAVTAADLSRK